jgi:hypothetical protein
MGADPPTLGLDPIVGRTVSTNVETIRPGISWNATGIASALIVVIMVAIAVAFWPTFDARDAEPAARRDANGLAAPHTLVMVDDEVCAQCLP